MSPRRHDLAPVPDLAGHTVVVTGGNAGLGLETVVALARAGAEVVLCARDAERGERARTEARRRAGSDRIEVAPLDLGSVASIHTFAEDFLTRHDRLDVLVNNAGLVRDERQETADGFEEVVGVNHLGHHLLARLLSERLVATASARVVTVTSMAHRRVLRRLTGDDLRGVGRYNPFVQYARSKLANILFTRELARRLGPEGVTAVCCHPGLVRSGLTSGSPAATGRRTMALAERLMVSPEVGARTQVALAARPDPGEVQGAYVVKGAMRRPSRLGADAAHARWLWDESERLLASIGVEV